jgi:hypothetical protein
MNTGLTLAGVLAFVFFSAAANAAAAQVPPVEFAVAKGNTTIFYPTRALRYGDRFEVNAHHLNQDNRLMVVPCRPDCAKPNFVLAYPLRFGVQHLRIPISGQYYFWVERDQIGGPDGWTRFARPVLSSQGTADHFVATFDEGTTLSIRTLDAHPIADLANLTH